MTYRNPLRLSLMALVLVAFVSTSIYAETAQGLRKRLATASASLNDLKGMMVVTSSNKSNVGEITKGALEFLDRGFRQANVTYKKPDKFRAEGEAKGVQATYVLNGNSKQIIIPSLMLKKTDNVAGQPGKKQSTLDLGFATDALWTDYNVKVTSQSKGVMQLQLTPKVVKDKRKQVVWIETSTLKVLKREVYGGKGPLKLRQVFSDHKKFGSMPIATVVKVYTPDGSLAGTVSYKDFKANTGVQNAQFTVK